MLVVLTYLEPVFDDDDSLKSQLEKQLKAMTDNINNFGTSSISDILLNSHSLFAWTLGNFCT